MASDSTTTHEFVTKSFNERRSLEINSPIASSPSLRANQSSSSTTAYASSTENISRLLEGWMRSSPKSTNKSSNFGNSASMTSNTTLQCYQAKAEQDGGGGGGGGDLVSHDEFDSIVSFENLNNAAWDKSTCDSMPETNKSCQTNAAANDDDNKVDVLQERNNNKQRSDQSSPPLSILEKWLLDESTAAGQVEEMMELSPMF